MGYYKKGRPITEICKQHFYRAISNLNTDFVKAKTTNLNTKFEMFLDLIKLT